MTDSKTCYNSGDPGLAAMHNVLLCLASGNKIMARYWAAQWRFWRIQK